MAGRTLITATTVSRSALTSLPTPTGAGDVANGNAVPNDGFTLLLVASGDAATHVLNVQLTNGVDGLTAGPRPYTVPVAASGAQLVGPFPLRYYGPQILLNADSTQIKIAAYSMVAV